MLRIEKEHSLPAFIKDTFQTLPITLLQQQVVALHHYHLVPA
jgi:hypothetical protein